VNLLAEKTTPTVEELQKQLNAVCQENIVLAGRILLMEWEAKDAARKADDRLMSHMRNLERDLQDKVFGRSKAADRIREFFTEREVTHGQ
jgi:hypothetical protein